MDLAREGDRQYLEKSGTNTLLKEAMIKLINNRPSDPISFLIDLFESKCSSGDNVQRAYRQIMLADYSRPVFDENLETAFDLLCQAKDGLRKLLMGDTFMDFISVIIKSFPSNVKTKIMSKMYCNDYDTITLPGFKASVTTCVLIQDYIRQVELLFNSLEVQSNGNVERSVSDAVKEVLQHSLLAAEDSHPSQYIKAVSLLSPREVFGQLYQITKKTATAKSLISREEFLLEYLDIFLSAKK